MDKKVELKDFVGKEFDLTAVSTAEVVANDKYGDFANASTITFTLDGVTYQAVEDPSDGYRSSLREIFICDTEPANRFPAQRVKATWKEPGSYDNDTVEFRSVASDLIVMEVGTDHVNDYYPCFVSNFEPKNMDINRTDDIRQKIAMEEAKRLEDERHAQDVRDKLNAKAKLDAQRDDAGWGTF
jgi:predicted NAD-dependent protein-ADP-ribosyltransferase YbiA (DUF1768 family)